MSELSRDYIFTYSRAQAIADGVLHDVSEAAREVGIKYPVAVSEAVWNKYVAVPDRAVPGQSERGRLHDVVWMLRCALPRSHGTELAYKLHVAIPDGGNWDSNEAVPERGSDLSRETHRLVTLKAVCGPGDDPAPVITIMLPSED